MSRVFFITTLLLFLSGCGLKGPLYLPDESTVQSSESSDEQDDDEKEDQP